MEIKTVTEMIQDDYKKWERGDVVYISAQTGMGKTFFVLNTLLPYYTQTEKFECFHESDRIKNEYRKKEIAHYDFPECNEQPISAPTREELYVPPRKGRRILYLVNRVALKQQIEKRMDLLPAEQKAMICIMTYQQIENAIKEMRPLAINLDSIGCIVCDECHYFMADSNFNTYTCCSYLFVMRNMTQTIRVFMSATIDDMQDFINSKSLTQNDYFWRTHKRPSKVYNYQGGFDYSYCNIHAFSDEHEIADIVINSGRGKWLIFVNDIRFGTHLKQELEDALKKHMENLPEKERKDISVGFLSSDFRYNREMAVEFNNITADSKSSVHILISTSVIDNGVDIKDEKLKNIILLADTRTEFIQMLGRKRRISEEKVELYIAKRNRKYFVDRLYNIIEAYKIASSFLARTTGPMTGYEYNNAVPLSNWPISNDPDNEIHKIFEMIDKSDNPGKSYEAFSRSFCNVKGKFYLNLLAEKNLELLVQYYQEIICEFDESENAFLIKQLKWLGKTDEEIEKLCAESCTEIYVVAKNRICEKIRSYIQSEATIILPVNSDDEESNTAMKLKEDIKDDVKIVLEYISENSGDEDVKNKCTSYRKDVGQNDRVISGKQMKFLHKYGELPFEVRVSGENYIIVDLEKAERIEE